MKRTFAQQLLKQGIAASKAGQRDDARRLLLQVIELNPSSEHAWLWLSGVSDSVGEQQHCLEQVLQINPTNSHALAGLAWLAQQRSQTVALETAPPPLVAQSPVERDSIIEQACPFCDKPISRSSTSCRFCHHPLVVACPTCEAQVDLEETTCADCGHHMGDFRQGAEYYAALGKAYLANLRPDPAIAAWQTVLEIDPRFPDAHLRLGEALAMANDWQGAYESLTNAAQDTNNPAAVYLGLGRVHEQRHQWDQAQSAYEQAVAADETSAAARFALGRLLAEGQALKEAFPHIRRSTELDATNAGAWYLLGQLYEIAQESRKAIQAYEHAVDLTDRGPADQQEWCTRAADRLETLRPSLPPTVALNWPETIRQTAGMVLLPALAALVNGGLRPWQIAPVEVLGILVAALGAYFWVSASSLPRNPGMRSMLGQAGLSQPALRTSIGVLGGLFWSTGLLYILLSPTLA